MSKKSMSFTIDFVIDDENEFRQAAYLKALDDGVDESEASTYLDASDDGQPLTACAIMVFDPGTSPDGCSISDSSAD